MDFELLVLLFLLIMSAFFSSSEIAFVASNKLKIKIFTRKNNLLAKSTEYFVNKPQNFFSTILIGNNFVNITFATITSYLLGIKYFKLNDFEILLISSAFVLIFGELIPKYLSREIPESLIKLEIIPIRFFCFILYPFVKIFSSLSNILTLKANIAEENIFTSFSKEDIEKIVEESKQAGIVNEKESDILSNILEIKDTRIYEIMKPRTEIEGIEINQPIGELIKLYDESGYSKIPVYEENLDNIKGVAIVLDIFKEPKTIQEITRDVIFVPETKKVNDMLKEFTSKRSSIAIVIDEFGGTAGLLTLEDVIEELFGEIRDEYDHEEHICRKLNDGSYIINGLIEIDRANELLDNIVLPEGDYETIAGYIIYNIGRIPVKDEILKIDNFTIQILRSSNTRIELIKLYCTTET